MGLISVIQFPFRMAFKAVLIAAQAFGVLWALHAAYDIRLYPIKDFGMIIHEFDPWFNYRAAEKMLEIGVSKFFKWYDYMSWYPLGRPIGTTIYPGMQMTALAIYRAMEAVNPFSYTLPTWLSFARKFLKALKTNFGFVMLPSIPKAINYAPMSMNDICCMMPPWFGSIASLFTGLLTYEITRSTNAGVMATGIMAIIPAHLMRSVGGEFDNEAVAMAAICSTLWLWLRAVRTPQSWYWGILAGLSYIYMVAAWGGYIFVINMVGIHALMLVGLGRFNSGVHKAYSLFFVIGTAGAIQVPVVGWTPLRSLEQLGPLLVFFGYQVLAICDYVRRSRNLTTKQFVLYRIRAMAYLLLILLGVGAMLYPTGYFGPLSSRIRGLFVKHTKTGNPLVDSVAEHQPASPGIYQAYLNMPLDYWQHGTAICLISRSNGCYLFGLYGFIASHFSAKMSRLVLICGPIAAIACAIWAGWLLDSLLQPFLLFLGKKGYKSDEPEVVVSKTAAKKAEKAQAAVAAAAATASADKKASGKKTNGKDSAKENGHSAPKKASAAPAFSKKRIALEEYEEEERPGGIAAIKRGAKNMVYNLVPDEVEEGFHQMRKMLDRNPLFLMARMAASVVFVAYLCYSTDFVKKTKTFVQYSQQMGQQLSNPQVVYYTQDRQGGRVLIDDYLKGYQWIDRNTPKESRVMAWWDYGYQITGIAKRTSIADGNTWNHEHIATLGRTLTSPEKRAWNAIRHMADYVLVWAGGRGDDLGKSPHLARIGNSVFPEHCGDTDPKCSKFGFYGDQTPTPMMAKSLLYNLVQHNMRPGVKVSDKYFKEVHTTKHGLMRVFQVMNVSEESRQWVDDPANKICDAPGSWYCTGQYPPALDKLIAKRRSFAQIEDFNKAAGGKSAYTKMIEKELEL